MEGHNIVKGSSGNLLPRKEECISRISSCLREKCGEDFIDDSVCDVLIQSPVLQYRKDPASTSPGIGPSNHVGSKIYG